MMEFPVGVTTVLKCYEAYGPSALVSDDVGILVTWLQQEPTRHQALVEQIEWLKAGITDKRRERKIANSNRRAAFHEARSRWTAFKTDSIHDHVRRVCQERDTLKALLPEAIWKEALGIGQ